MSEPSEQKNSSNIRIGIAGWSYPDWIGIVYPKPLPKGYSQLRQMAEWFDLMEINASFYHTPSPKNAESWLAQIAEFPRFQFAAKLHREFTHEGRIERDAVRAFRDFLSPLAGADRLVALLLQFPWSFRATESNWVYLERLCTEFREYPLAVEFRHDTWWTPHWFVRLREAGISLANIDQPKLENNIPPDEVLTGPLAYIRFHGRNAEAWWAEKEAYYGARYDYLYECDELSDWSERATRMAIKADNAVIVFNNHHRGDAVVGAMQFAHLLHMDRGEIPETLAQRYPEHYRGMNRPIRKESKQGDLFGG